MTSSNDPAGLVSLVGYNERFDGRALLSPIEFQASVTRTPTNKSTSYPSYGENSRIPFIGSDMFVVLLILSFQTELSARSLKLLKLYFFPTFFLVHSG